MHQSNFQSIGASELLEPHPLLGGFELAAAELDAEAEDLRRRGVPAAFYKRGDVLLDDYNRYLACRRAGVEIKYIEWDGSGSLADHLLDAVLPRVRLSEGQAAAKAVPFADQYAAEAEQASRANLVPNAKRRKQAGLLGAAREIKNHSQTAFLENPLDAAKLQHREISKSCEASAADVRVDRDGPVERAARRFGVSVRYVFEAKKLRDDWPRLYEALDAGRMSLPDAKRAIADENRAARQRALAAAAAVNAAAERRGRGDQRDRCIVGDCLKVMGQMLQQGLAFDLIFADPPYNNGTPYDGDKCGDLRPPQVYLDECRRWIGQCAQLLAPAGSMFVMINSQWQAHLAMMMHDTGLLHWRNYIVWDDNFPNCDARRFQPAGRPIHYFSRSDKHFAWNPDAVRIPSRRIADYHDARADPRGMVPHDVWGGKDNDPLYRIPGNALNRVPFPGGPPQAPEEILERILLCASNPGDRVLDPFLGNGTTWRAARKLGRKFTGIERSPKYAAHAEQWAMAQPRPE